MSWFAFRPYVPVAKKRADAQKKIAALGKTEKLSPVVISGKKIARTWWGASWCANLERYADYDNRIERGRSYVRNGQVIDLSIADGKVTARVMGSELYRVEIAIDGLAKKKWRAVAQQVGRRIDGMAELVEGKFPEELCEIFMRQGDGLFPSPREIHMQCSCPDYAVMCKHVAAALYGIGARLDDDPLLFFKLRAIPFEELLKKSVDEKMKNLLKNANRKTDRVLKGDIVRIFGL
ncbi:MAG: SWIM zinc finger family protein [Candidatus Accumulibacter sp.]|jgi:uncharacterized Zn finger protein|nr:SWIM zinc finger family protein [Accumulibacter sp.]